MSEPKATIPKGSLVLVTGATGFVASQVVRQFLDRGYKVRGTVRDLEQAYWVNDINKAAVERGDLELVEVRDLAAPNAFDGAIKGAAAIAHLATISNFDPNPNNVVPQTVAGVTTILEAAAKESSVKEFVFTSSIMSATYPVPGNKTHVERDTWNDAAVESAWAPPPYQPERAMATYAASKLAAEKEVWRYVEEHQVHFNVNVISPSGILGEPLHKKHAESPAAWVTTLWNGVVAMLEPYPNAFFVDVKDIALLHVAAILDPEVKNARLQAWGHSSNWNDMLAILRELRPQKEFIPNFANDSYLTISTDQSESVALLEKWANQHGWKSMKDMISDNIDSEFFN